MSQVRGSFQQRRLPPNVYRSSRIGKSRAIACGLSANHFEIAACAEIMIARPFLMDRADCKNKRADCIVPDVGKRV
jgi:hypothetical protein